MKRIDKANQLEIKLGYSYYILCLDNRLCRVLVLEFGMGKVKVIALGSFSSEWELALDQILLITESPDNRIDVLQLFLHLTGVKQPINFLNEMLVSYGLYSIK